MAGLLIFTLFLGVGIGHLSAQNEPYKTRTVDTCPAEITSLDALTVALHDPEIIELLDKKNVSTIAFSKGSYPERNTNYTQIVFHLHDPDLSDHMTAPRIVVQINDSCMVSAAYETYPSYIPNITTGT